MREIALLIAGLILLGGVPSLPVELPSWTWTAPAPPAAATAAVYVYEKDSHAIPTGVTVGINRLNRERKIVATLLEDDTTDGTGEVPEQYRTALDAARKSGLPSLVVLSGSTVLATISAPATADEIVRAVP